MKVEIRSDSVHISGYVNAVDRYSRILKDKNGKRFREKILPGAFRRSLERNGNITVKLNHERDLTQVSKGGITLKEDNIGLYFDGDIRDKEVIERARDGKLVGWSFGFTLGEFSDTPVEGEEYDYKRAVKELGLLEVSIVDNRCNPCYEGTLLQTRADTDVFVRGSEDEAEVSEDPSRNYAAENSARKRKLNLKKRK